MNFNVEKVEDVIYLHVTLHKHVLNHMKGSLENDDCILLLLVRFQEICYIQTCLWTLITNIYIYIYIYIYGYGIGLIVFGNLSICCTLSRLWRLLKSMNVIQIFLYSYACA
jgi:hypothetical protein